MTSRGPGTHSSFIDLLVGYPSQVATWRWIRLAVLMAVDATCLASAFWLAFALRFDFAPPAEQFVLFKTLVVPVVVIALAFFLREGVYRQVWRYATAQSATLLLRATVYATVTCLAASYLTAKWPPRSIFPLFLLLAFMLVAATRFVWRFVSTMHLRKADITKPRCIIYGAGVGGSTLLRNILLEPRFPYIVMGFVDDSSAMKGRAIQGVRILGTGSALHEVCTQTGSEVVIIAMPSATGQTVRKIVDRCQQIGVKPLIMPELASALDSSVFKPRPIDIRDLLKRSPRSADIEGTRRLLAGQTVLVTGAGGSIGSEIARQVVRFRPNRVILADSCEFALYQIDEELRSLGMDSIEIISRLGSVVESRFLEPIFEQFAPTIVLHAAAYKHVPLVEANPVEGVFNNVFGTLNVANLSAKHGASRFVLISSDKAVRPTSVMGASKRCCELGILALNSTRGGRTKFCAVRFGNVLGSSGSVVPKFIEQINRGGPVTVTHPDMKRYFMLVSEAVALVLQAASLSVGGEIFVLDMGEPVNIAEMASQLIRLSGKQPGSDIELQFTGLRPGEKLFEELILEGVEKRTQYEEIFVNHTQVLDPDAVLEDLHEVIESCRSNQRDKVVAGVMSIAEGKSALKNLRQIRGPEVAATLVN